MTGCPDDDTLAAFADRRLSDAQRAALVAHLEGCAGCNALVAHLARHGIGARSSTLAAEGPAPGDDDARLQPGDLVGRYRISSILGQGGMGRVYLARDLDLDRQVALKVLRRRRGDAGSGELHARLRREAQALAQFTHEHIVTVHDVGEADGRLFVVMEFVAGVTLAEWLGASPRTWRDVLDVMLRAGEGLAAAHSKGLVHRDFKPANVLCGHDGRVRVADFGLVRSSPTESAGDAAAPGSYLALGLTRKGDVCGTPRYMAPEQWQGAEVDHRADLFSFCVVLYEALYGQPPYSGQSFDELEQAVLKGEISPPPIDRDVPQWLRDVILPGLRPDPAQRPSSMQVLLLELRGEGGILGRVAAGYRVCRLLARTGAGEVYEAVHEQIGQRAAIKVVDRALAANPLLTRRFLAEAQAASTVRHPNLVTIFNFGQLANGAPYILMELLDGEDLHDRLHRSETGRGRVPLDLVYKVAAQISSALCAIHSAGMIHRDVKPSNIRIVPDANGGEYLKLLDLGLVYGVDECVEEGGAALTMSLYNFAGTPMVAAPEQFRGEPLSPAVDVYALGVTLYRMLAGKYPFEGPGLADILGQHLFADVPPLSRWARWAPRPLCDLVHAMMNKQPESRPSMDEVRDRIAGLVHSPPAPTAEGGWLRWLSRRLGRRR